MSWGTGVGCMVCKILGSSRSNCMSAARNVSDGTVGVDVVVVTGSRGGDCDVEFLREASDELEDAIVLVGV